MTISKMLLLRGATPLLLLTLLAAGAGAQQLPAARPANAPPPGPPQDAITSSAPTVPTIVANSDLVNVVFSVEDKHGAPVAGLAQSDFRVFEDSRPQTVRFFSVEHQLPLTLGLLLDTSPSQAGVLGEEQRMSDDFFHQVVGARDLAFVVGFDVDTRLLQDLTSSPSLLDRAVDEADIGGGEPTASIGGVTLPGPFPTSARSGATHLWDAIYLACHEELAHQSGRKAIVVVTDGGEQGSTYTRQEALRAALDTNTVVFTLLTADRAYVFGGYDPGPEQGELKKIVDQTGGRTIMANRHMPQAFSEIEQVLRNQYSLGYRSDRPKRDGQFRRIEIELVGAAANRGYKIHARSGYFAN